MSIQVKFFASMRDLMGEDRTLETKDVAEDTITVADIWNYCASGKAKPTNVLVAVNMDYVDDSSAVKDGDEVAFFPPVTGG